MQKSYLIPSKLLIKCWANFTKICQSKVVPIQQKIEEKQNFDLMQSQHKHLFTKVLQASNWFAEKKTCHCFTKVHRNHQLKYYIYERSNHYTSRSSHFQIQDYDTYITIIVKI